MAEQVDVERAMGQLSGFISVCVQCPLHASRTNAVPGEGPVDARLVLVGEAPGAREDKQGRPFVGRAGRVLDGLLEDVGLVRQDVYITNSVKCRPPENRNPRVGELRTCGQIWLQRQMDIIGPGLIVLMGKVPAKQVLDETGSLEDVHGEVRERGSRRHLITYHPASVFHADRLKDLIRKDLARARDIVG